MRSFISLPLVLLLSACSNPASEPAGSPPAWQETADGVVVTPVSGPFRRVRLQAVSDGIVRVTATPQAGFDNLPDSLMVVDQAPYDDVSVSSSDGVVRLDAGRVAAEVSLESGAVRFLEPGGDTLLAEAGRSLGPVTADPGAVDDDSYRIRQQFAVDRDVGLYGLGQRQDGLVNLAGQNVELTTYNMEITIPYLVSTARWGLLWNNSSVTRLGEPDPAQPLAAGFDLYDADGRPGGLTARYYDGDRLLLTRTETDPDYQFLVHGNVRVHPFPAAVADAADLRVEWEGYVVPRRSGPHELKMYSSGYARLRLDGELLLDRWRVNWNPWYHDTTVNLEAGHRYPLRIDWRAQGGYFRLLHYAPPAPGTVETLSLASDTGKAVDYYLVAGDSMDALVAGYRQLTGKAVMLPKWAYGFWQSRERYTSQQELLGVLEEYRERQIPIDNIVLDWSYWPQDAWGSHDFDPDYFPDPAAMVDRVHELDARIMISVWPKFYPTTEHYKALNAMGCMFNKNIEQGNVDWIGPGYPNAFYDAFDANCRALYWKQIETKLNVLGFDAWWLDAVEPDMHSNLTFENRKNLMSPNALGTGAEYFNAYALPHAETVYANERKVDADRRSFILTRSGFGGIQRTGSAIWSGDVASRWSDLREQIAAGVSVGLAGMPYWTFDIGGFTPENPYRWDEGATIGRYDEVPAAYRDEWQELNLRWFQFGAFTPLFRSHGQNPYREIFNLADEGSEVYDSLVWYTRLRYRLMPYIYTLAGDAHQRDGTLMRALVMDFPDDRTARDVTTQFLFGPAFLVNPVSEFGARSRPVYLPAGNAWHDFNSGTVYAGGATIEAAAPLGRMPLFVRAGAIVPTGPDIQHTGASLNAPLLLQVYTGADGRFEIYEDDGLSYDYERGQWSRIPVGWDEARGRLTLGAREGGFEGMAPQRRIAVRWIDAASAPGAELDAEPDLILDYDGSQLIVDRPR